MRAEYAVHIILPDFVTVIIVSEEYNCKALPCADFSSLLLLPLS
jgi:hypothetical protein